ncbi:MAG TPA: TPM domain-containing protein [Syntrophorhabdaceae bacterium]|nr:TPM domain-containing protein [Syntrophorhabdaceae bacterium]
MYKQIYKKSSLIFGFLILFIFSLLISINTHSLDVPPLKGYVNDYAYMMSTSVKSRLEKELKLFEQTESTQIIILTIPSLEGEVLEEFSIKVAENWKIGQKGKDNGVILVVAKKERRLRIEVGKGLEGTLTDLIAGRIIDMVIKPRFKRGDFDGGFIAGVHAIMDAVKGEFKGETERIVPSHKNNVNPIWTFLLFLGVMVIFFGRFSKIFSAIIGALGLPLITFFVFSPPFLILIILGTIGFFIGMLLPSIFYRTHGKRDIVRSHPIYWGTGGGIDLGSGDGFSGGGGEFGGGGASGDW